ncbi:M23 family metallopeptidase [Cohnella hashimotonis]|uniref:M23 family metallopeptidase n=1 Tax=Cohnella hashimotonis TaxID=2826895 RepID=UPI0033131984
MVGVGDAVKRGELLGLCGNSGNSSEAHLHFQVSDSPNLFQGKSIRIHWENGLNPQQLSAFWLLRRYWDLVRYMNKRASGRI